MSYLREQDVLLRSTGGAVVEKISKVIPANSRLTSINMSKERPVRAGTPSFGAPVAESDLGTRYSRAAVDAAPNAFDMAYGSDAKLTDLKHQKIIKDLETKFFENQASRDPKPLVISPVSEGDIKLRPVKIDASELESDMGPIQETETSVDMNT